MLFFFLSLSLPSQYLYREPPIVKHVQMLIQIAVNTLEGHFHRCKPTAHYLSPAGVNRSRDMSAASIEFAQDNQDQDSTDSDNKQEETKAADTSQQDSETEDNDDELAVIPESPKSESRAPSGPSAVAFDRISEETKTPSISNDSPAKASVCGTSAAGNQDKSTSSDAAELPSEKSLLSEATAPVISLVEDSKAISEPIPSSARSTVRQESLTKPPASRSRSPSPNRPSLQRMRAIEDPQTKSLPKENLLSSSLDQPVTAKTDKVADPLVTEQKRTSEGVSKLLRAHSQPEHATGPMSVFSSSLKEGSLEKPAPERLLPIGPPSRESTPKPLKCHPYHEHYERPYSSTGHSSAGGSGHFQTIHDQDFHLPNRERLLPIGPLPVRDRSKSPGPQSIRRLTSPPRLIHSTILESTRVMQPGPPPLMAQQMQPQIAAPMQPQMAAQIQQPMAAPIEPAIPQPLPPPVQNIPIEAVVISMPPPLVIPIPPPLPPAIPSESVTPLPASEPQTPLNLETKSEPIQKIPDVKKEPAKKVDDKALSKSDSPKVGKKEKKKTKKEKGIQSHSQPNSPKGAKAQAAFSRPPSLDKQSKKNFSTQSTLESLGQSISIDFGDDEPVKTVVESSSKQVKTPPLEYKSSSGSEKKVSSSAGRYKQRRQRKTGLSTVEAQRSLESKGTAAVTGGVAAGVQRRARKTDSNSTTTTLQGSGDGKAGFSGSKRASTSQGSITGLTFGPDDETNIYERCPTCANVIERFSDEELGMCIVILGKFP